MPVRPCTSRISAPQTLLIAMPASSRLGRRQLPLALRGAHHDEQNERRADERAGPDADDARHHVPVERDRDHGAERGASRDAKRVRRGQRIAQHRLEQAARERERTAGEQPEQRAREPQIR